MTLNLGRGRCESLRESSGARLMEARRVDGVIMRASTRPTSVARRIGIFYNDDTQWHHSMPPLNMPPTYKDYERGRVLVAFNSTWESQSTVPSVAEPEPTLLVEPAWCGLSVIFLEFLNFNFVKMASTRRHVFMKPSTRLSERLHVV